MTPEQAADRDAARVITNEYVDARDAGADARWTPGGRRRAGTSPIYRAWLRRLRAATAALKALQAACSHDERSFFSRSHCDRCALQLPTDEAARMARCGETTLDPGGGS